MSPKQISILRYFIIATMTLALLGCELRKSSIDPKSPGAKDATDQPARSVKGYSAKKLELGAGFECENDSKSFTFRIDSNRVLRKDKKTGAVLDNFNAVNVDFSKSNSSKGDSQIQIWSAQNFRIINDVKVGEARADYFDGPFVERYSCIQANEPIEESMINAACGGRANELLAFAASKGVDFNVTGSRGETVVSCLLKNRYFDLFKKLTEAHKEKIDPNALPESGESWLLTAIEQNKIDLMRFILQNYPSLDPNAQRKQGPQDSAFTALKSKEQLQILLNSTLASRLDVNLSTQKDTLLTKLADGQLLDSVAMVKLLLARADLDINKKNSNGESPIFVAARNNAEIFWLLRNDPRVLAPGEVNINGQSVFHVDKNPLNIVIWKDLVNWVALPDPERLDTFKRSPVTALLNSCRPAIESCSEYLNVFQAKFSSDLSKKDGTGKSPLEYIQNSEDAKFRKAYGILFGPESRKFLLFQRSSETQSYVFFKRAGRFFLKQCPRFDVDSVSQCGKEELEIPAEQVSTILADPLYDLRDAISNLVEIENAPEYLRIFKVDSSYFDVVKAIQPQVQQCAHHLQESATIQQRIESCGQESRGDFKLVARKRSPHNLKIYEVWWDSKLNMLWGDTTDEEVTYSRLLNKSKSEVDPLIACPGYSRAEIPFGEWGLPTQDEASNAFERGFFSDTKRGVDYFWWGDFRKGTTGQIWVYNESGSQVYAYYDYRARVRCVGRLPQRSAASPSGTAPALSLGQNSLIGKTTSNSTIPSENGFLICTQGSHKVHFDFRRWSLPKRKLRGERILQEFGDGTVESVLSEPRTISRDESMDTVEISSREGILKLKSLSSVNPSLILRDRHFNCQWSKSSKIFSNSQDFYFDCGDTWLRVLSTGWGWAVLGEGDKPRVSMEPFKIGGYPIFEKYRGLSTSGAGSYFVTLDSLSDNRPRVATEVLYYEQGANLKGSPSRVLRCERHSDPDGAVESERPRSK